MGASTKTIQAKLIRRQSPQSPIFRFELHPDDETLGELIEAFQALRENRLQAIEMASGDRATCLSVAFDDSRWSYFKSVGPSSGKLFINDFHVASIIAFLKKYVSVGPLFPPFAEVPFLTQVAPFGEITSYFAVHVSRAAEAPRWEILDIFDRSDSDKLH